jgi:hypothetical protein
MNIARARTEHLGPGSHLSVPERNTDRLSGSTELKTVSKDTTSWIKYFQTQLQPMPTLDHAEMPSQEKLSS